MAAVAAVAAGEVVETVATARGVVDTMVAALAAGKVVDSVDGAEEGEMAVGEVAAMVEVAAVAEGRQSFPKCIATA